MGFSSYRTLSYRVERLLWQRRRLDANFTTISLSSHNVGCPKVRKAFSRIADLDENMIYAQMDNDYGVFREAIDLEYRDIFK